jgi:folate-binding protein YgfZ
MTCGFFLIPSTILTVSGRDAERYLQARLTNDVRALAPGQFCDAAALTPQGRTEAFCAVLKRSPQEFLLLCESDRHEEIYTAVRRFLVAERAEVKALSSELLALHLTCPDRSTLPGMPVLPASPATVSPSAVHEQEGVIAISRRRTPTKGWDIILPREKLESLRSALLTAEIQELDPQEQKLLRLRAGIPSFPEELNSEHLFSESGLMHAVSFTKGCYTGQEVVAKIDALGKTPRVLRRLKLEGVHSISPGSSVESAPGGSKIGTVLSAAADSAELCTWCFCDLKNVGDFSGMTPQIGGLPAQFAAEA